MLPRLFALGAMLCACVVARAGEAEVSFVNVDKYTDAVIDARESDLAQRKIEEHLKQLAARHLPAGDKLVVQVLDIDLAGRLSMRPGRLNEVRVLTNVTWPTIRLRYRLVRGGEILREGEEAVSDLAYMSRGNRYFNDDLFRYEMQMLDDWFRRTFGPQAKTRR